MINKIIIFLFLLSAPNHKFQKKIERYDIKLNEYNIYFFPDKGINHSYVYVLSSGNKLYIYLLSLKGSCKIKCYYQNGKLKESGYYKAANDIKKDSSVMLSADSFTLNSFSSKVYVPTRQKEWVFYDSVGNVNKKFYK